MRGVSILIASIVLSGCGCGRAQQRGDADTSSDALEDAYWTDEPETDDLCGNGVVDDGEECDDGNRMNGDGCTWDCRIGDGEPGDGTPDPGVPPVEPSGPPVEVVTGDHVPPSGCALDLEWNGEQYSIVYHHMVDSTCFVTFRRFDVEGTELPNDWDIFSGEWGGLLFVDHVWTGTDYGVFYASQALVGIWFVRVGAEGKRLSDPVRVVHDDNVRGLEVAWSSSVYGITWSHAPESMPNECEEAYLPVMFSVVGERGEEMLAEPVEIHSRATYPPGIIWGDDGAFRLSSCVMEDTEVPLGCFHPVVEYTILPTGDIVEQTVIGHADIADIAWREGEYMIIFTYYDSYWRDSPYGGTYTALFTGAGELLGPPHKTWEFIPSTPGIRITHDPRGYAMV